MLVVLTQAMIYYFLIMPIFSKCEVAIHLSGILLPLFMLTTLLIAASGYVVNDIQDVPADLHNKAENRLIGNGIDIGAAKFYYWILVLLGFIISIYIGFNISEPLLILIYPMGIGLLYWYSMKLKKLGIYGNMVVALFTAFVPGILLIAERQLLIGEHQLLLLAGKVIMAFSMFSFIINLQRELVKDIEDIEGDMLIGSKSVPLANGIAQSKIIIYFYTFILIVILITTHFYFEYRSFRSWVFLLVFICAPLMLSMVKLHQAKFKADYHHISVLYKWIMMSGLILLLLVSNSMVH